jgi:two-component system, OmpR family, sensor histidine kinase VicK
MNNVQIAILFVTTLILVGLVFVVYRVLKNNASGGNTAKLQGTLRDEKLKSSLILSGIEDGVVMIDADKNIQSFNHGASTITGWPADEALTINCDMIFKLVDAKNNPYEVGASPFDRVFNEAGTIHDNSAMLITRSDKTIAISLSVSPLSDDKGNVTAAVAVFRDVSQQRAEEQQRAEFISTASHEMRTPVAAIEGYLALALNDKVSTIDSRARNYLEKAHSSTQHLGKLFQDLLTSAKAEDGRLSSHPSVIEMSSYLEKLSEDLKFAAEKKGLFTEFILGASDVIDASNGSNVIKPLYYIHADPDRLREVITNLFDNACKYTESGKVTIGLTGNNDVVQFYVKDTGSGIPTEDIPHLFQKFYRVDNSQTRTIGGTGLGLFISRKVIELYGGHIWAESELGKGSTFFVNLPRITSARAEQLKSVEASDTKLPTITSLTDSVVQ